MNHTSRNYNPAAEGIAAAKYDAQLLKEVEAQLEREIEEGAEAFKVSCLYETKKGNRVSRVTYNLSTVGETRERLRRLVLETPRIARETITVEGVKA